jgi:hypothetical protein
MSDDDDTNVEGNILIGLDVDLHLPGPQAYLLIHHRGNGQAGSFPSHPLTQTASTIAPMMTTPPTMKEWDRTHNLDTSLFLRTFGIPFPETGLGTTS